MPATDLRKWCPPILLIAGLVLFGLAFATWGVGAEGVKPTVSGLGKVTISGLSADDVGFLQDHTGRPGLVTLVLGAIVAISAVLAWWRTELSLIASAVAAIAGVAAVAWTVLTLAAPETRLFDEAVNDALDGGSSVLNPGWGLIGSIVMSVVCAVVGVGGTYIAAKSKV